MRKLRTVLLAVMVALVGIGVQVTLLRGLSGIASNARTHGTAHTVARPTLRANVHCILPAEDLGDTLPAQGAPYLCLDTHKPITLWDMEHPCFRDGLGTIVLDAQTMMTVQTPCGTFVAQVPAYVPSQSATCADIVTGTGDDTRVSSACRWYVANPHGVLTCVWHQWTEKYWYEGCTLPGMPDTTLGE